MLTLIGALVLAKQAPVMLSRKFVKGEKLVYRYEGGVLQEERQIGLLTMMPNTQDLKYTFTLDCLEERGNNVAIVRYRRPDLTVVLGETAERGPKSETVKMDMDMNLTVSGANDILDIKDNKPPKKDKPEKKDDGDGLKVTNFRFSKGAKVQGAVDAIAGQFISELVFLSIFYGSFDSSLDFNPYLPFEPVAPGATWKKTMGFQPQKVKGKKESQVQRFDATFTYVGKDTFEKQAVNHVKANLALDTDVASFFNQQVGATAEQTGIKQLPLKFQAEVHFYLDATTGHTLYSEVNSKTTYKLWVVPFPNEPYEEGNIKGHAELRLASRTVTGVKAPVKPTTKTTKTTKGKKGGKGGL
ncbi:MAG: hypothetical protein JST35_03050 [Armatimonadetes bacterium]|nr:hypothetical protein [Armatimonadota bacterium]